MRKGMWVGVFLAVLGVISPAVSEARSTPAMLGRPASASQLSCVNVDHVTGGVTNASCGSSIQWELGLPLDSNGGHSGSFTMKMAGSFASNCRAVGIGRDGIGGTASNLVTTSIPNTFETLSWTGANVPANGLLYMQCNMNLGSVFTKADHSPS